jgi:lipopolysaccharide biosynthesis protein
MSKSIRPIAFHLPQFHPIPENDAWWGKGFTEWANVTKAKPLFKGHYQPHLPADLGFYDLRVPEVREEQAKLANEYGIYGFCYYHYWFNGKRLLERPVEEILKSGKPDFPFMLCWANENWSRTWDGGDNVILMRQEYSDRDAQLHCQALIPYFRDERYIKIGYKPVFVVYKPQIIPGVERYIDTFRGEAQKAGIELYICAVENQETVDDAMFSFVFDAAIEFQPQSKFLLNFMEETFDKKYHQSFGKKIYGRMLNKLRQTEAYEYMIHKIRFHLDYNEYVDYVLANYKYAETYKRFPGVSPMWDNTSRRGKKAFLLKNSNPEKYAQWLKFHYENFAPLSEAENFIFINAWNEWAEGNHLEPCQKWGHSFLEATKKVITNNKHND